MRIPVITTEEGLLERLNQWQRELKGLSKKVFTPKIPWNFTVVSKQGGNQLSWAEVDEGDGYIIEYSTSEDFTSPVTILIADKTQTQYFDQVATSGGVAPARRCYRMYATAGSDVKPQSVKGNYTQIVCATAIAPNDTVTASTTVADNGTSDSDQAMTRHGRYDPLTRDF